MPGFLTRLRRPADAGFTLVEMLVVIILMGVIGGIVTATVTTTAKTQRITQDDVSATSSERAALARMVRDIRTADPLVSADANDLTLDMWNGSNCVRRRYYVSGTALLMDQTNWSGSGQCGTYGATLGSTVTYTVMSKVSNGSTAPMFTYYQWNSASAAPVALTTPVAAASVGGVSSIAISVRVPVLGLQNPVVLSSTVDLRNVRVS